MMLPGTTISPPYFLTPSRRPRLSRPLREEPPAFLCAIAHSIFSLRAFFVSWAFLGRHAGCTPDLVDAQRVLVLAVPFFARVFVPPLLFEDDDLGRAGLLHDGGGARGPRQQRRPCRHLGALADHQHFAQLDRSPGL